MAKEFLMLTPVGTPVYSAPEYWQEIKPKNERKTRRIGTSVNLGTLHSAF